MCQHPWLDLQLERWGDWVRHDSGLGYGGCVLGVPRRSSDGDALDDDDGLRLERAVAALPANLVRALKLRYIADLPNNLAAERLRINERTYRRWLQRAKSILASGTLASPPPLRGRDARFLDKFPAT